MIIGGSVAEWTVGAVTVEAAIDDIRFDRADCIIAEPQAFHDTGPEVFQHDISCFGQALKERIAARVLEVKLYAGFAGILGNKGGSETGFAFISSVPP